MKFKTVMIAAAAILVIGAVTIVSCNKDNDNTVENTSAKSVKGNSKLYKYMADYYAACDKAYEANPDYFLSACEKNDYNAFQKLTGITEEMTAAIQQMAWDECKSYMAYHPEIEKEVKPAFDCEKEALPRLGELALQCGGNLSAFTPVIESEHDMDKFARVIFSAQHKDPFIMATAISAAMRSMADDLRDKKFHIFFDKCEYAYVNFSKELETVCDKDDYEGFCKVINLSQKAVCEMAGLSRVNYIDFLRDNPNYKPTSDTCKSCKEGSLYALWISIGEVHNLIEKINNMAPGYLEKHEPQKVPTGPCVEACIIHYRDTDATIPEDYIYLGIRDYCILLCATSIHESQLGDMARSLEIVDPLHPQPAN